MENTQQNVVAKFESHTTSQMSIYSNEESFNRALSIAKQLCASSMVPKDYQNNVANTMVAMELANRTGASVLMVMQNMTVIQGKPSWASQFIIAVINACGRFSPLRFKYQDLGYKDVTYIESTGYGQNRQRVQKTIKVRDYSCIAYATDASGEALEGPAVTVETAVKEGWYTKDGSKWPTMTKLMLSYRAAAFFGRLYAPDILQGMQSLDEVTEVHGHNQHQQQPSAVEILNNTVSPESGHFDNAQIIDEEIQ